ncbi:hypothetical protein BM613_11285 [Sulfoacidibacillus thermotolerans]|uniref:Fis family transcriptional regulator n=1 Tax=Sulfoacidibacillus thermotolerans TaxID=1765684 RepID=A0A2U3D6J6_SULT2|nr:hypothetical protein BM613_11285 [Sulfoacidibacillus thermotolerans]
MNCCGILLSYADQNDLLKCNEVIRKEHHRFVFLEIDHTFYFVKSFILLGKLHDARLETLQIRDLSNEKPMEAVPIEELSDRAMDILSEEVTLVRIGNELRYITREDFLLSLMSDADQSKMGWLHSLFSSIPKGLMVVNLEYTVVNSNAESIRMLCTTPQQMIGRRLDELLGSSPFQQVQLTQIPLLNQLITLPNNQGAVLVDFVPLIEGGVMTGFALVLQDLPTVNSMAMELDSVKNLNADLETILSTIYDEIIVVDREGRLLRASAHYIETHWERAPKEWIGEQIFQVKSARDLVCQVIRKVQKTGIKVSLMQKEGEAPLLSVGNPIFTKDGKPDRIVVASRDLTEMARLQRELEFTRKQSENYRKKYEELQDRLPSARGGGMVFASPSMFEVMKEVERISQFSATVLLTGESGVGKEVVANAIHSLSARRDHPLIKINCASIPESLLESELFGYVKGAFSGARSEGKSGLFIKADKGTLFLDEISELPLNIQSKLLRAIQEREVYPVGATTPVKFDVQIICAANRSLEELVEKGEFRADLFYRINVFPIHIPPLRERKEDIAVLAHHLLHEFNQMYNRNLRFSRASIELLEAYEFKRKN